MGAGNGKYIDIENEILFLAKMSLGAEIYNHYKGQTLFFVCQVQKWTSVQHVQAIVYILEQWDTNEGGVASPALYKQ